MRFLNKKSNRLSGSSLCVSGCHCLSSQIEKKNDLQHLMLSFLPSALTLQFVHGFEYVSLLVAVRAELCQAGGEQRAGFLPSEFMLG